MYVQASRHKKVYEQRLKDANERISWILDQLETVDEIQPERVLGARFPLIYIISLMMYTILYSF